MRKKNMLSKFRVFLLVAIFLIFSPLYVCFFILALIFACLPVFNTRIARENIRERLHIVGIKSVFFIARIYMNYLFYCIEAFILSPLRLTYCSSFPEENVERVIRESKLQFKDVTNANIAFILPHMGNVEMYAIPVIKAFNKLNLGRVSALGKPSRFALVNKFLFHYRLHSGIFTIWTDKNILKSMLREIKKGSSFCLLVDQKPQKDGLFIQFFNKYAAFPTSGLNFCMRNKMIVIYAVAKRVLPGWERIELKCGLNPHLQDNLKLEGYNVNEICPGQTILEQEKNVALEMSCFVAWLEKNIQKNPTQWCWDYKKWSREPRF